MPKKKQHLRTSTQKKERQTKKGNNKNPLSKKKLEHYNSSNCKGCEICYYIDDYFAPNALT